MSKSMLGQKELRQLTRYLTTKLAEGGRFQVVPEADLYEALMEEKAASYKECFDEKCQIEIGREVAAQKTLSSEISELGDSCVLTSTLYDLAKAASEQAASHRSSCKMNELVKSLEIIAAKLRGDPDPTVERITTPGGSGIEEVAAETMRQMPTMFRFATKEPNLVFDVEIVSDDGTTRRCEQAVRANAPCELRNLEPGPRRMHIANAELEPYGSDINITSGDVVVHELRQKPSDFGMITWIASGVTLATGTSLMTVGILVEDESFIYASFPALGVGVALFVTGFLLDGRIEIVEQTEEATSLTLVPTSNGVAAVGRF